MSMSLTHKVALLIWMALFGLAHLRWSILYLGKHILDVRPCELDDPGNCNFSGTTWDLVRTPIPIKNLFADAKRSSHY